MRILIACEESGIVCEEFRKLGHYAWSCDLKPTSGNHPEWHIQADILDIIYRAPKNMDSWDLMIAHPPCTYLCNSGVRWLYNKDGSTNVQRSIEINKARIFFYNLWNAPIERICIENPIPHKWGHLPKYNQLIQPWEFGHGETKATCLWLKNLPQLIPTEIVEGREQRIHKMSPGPERSTLRSKTYRGIAKAMSKQWGRYLEG